MPPADLMSEIASDEVLDQAYLWLCDRRKRHGAQSDVWTLRWGWPEDKPEVRQALLSGAYRFSPLERFHHGEETLEVWSSRDALVLKAVAIVLTRHLAPHIPSICHHLAGNGGAQAAVRRLSEEIPASTFVFRSDIKGYYASIDHDVLFAQLKEHIADVRVLDLLWQYLRRVVYDQVRYEDVKLGISLRSSLSPLMAALYLKPLDQRMAATGLFYARFMDDWVLLAPSRWKLRRAVRCVNQTLAELKVQQAPDKTFIGRVSRGFDFLGFRFAASGLVGVAVQTVHRCAERIAELYEQRADNIRIGRYVRRWWAWVCRALGKAIALSADDRHDAWGPVDLFPPPLGLPQRWRNQFPRLRHDGYPVPGPCAAMLQPLGGRSPAG